MQFSPPPLWKDIILHRELTCASQLLHTYCKSGNFREFREEDKLANSRISRKLLF